MIKTRHWMPAAALLGCLALSACNGAAKSGYTGREVDSNSGSTSELVNTFTCRHSVTVKDIPAGTKVVRLWLPVPQNDQYQTVSNVKVTDAPATVSFHVESEYGNKFAYCEVNNPATPSVTMGYSFTITRRIQSLTTPVDQIQAVSEMERGKMAKYLKPNTWVTVNDRIAQIANDVCGAETNPVKQAKLAYQWTIDHAEYWKKDKTKYAPSGHGSTEYFIDKCTGNCTDFHAAFMSLMMARGVPTRFKVGSVFWKDKQGKDEDLSYHCWPEFWAPGHGWVAIDSSQADVEADKQDFYFGNLETRRVVFTEGRDINLAPRQTGGVLDYFAVAFAEIDGQVCPADKMARKLTYDIVK